MELQKDWGLSCPGNLMALTLGLCASVSPAVALPKLSGMREVFLDPFPGEK